MKFMGSPLVDMSLQIAMHLYYVFHDFLYALKMQHWNFQESCELRPTNNAAGQARSLFWMMFAGHTLRYNTLHEATRSLHCTPLHSTPLHYTTNWPFQLCLCYHSTSNTRIRTQINNKKRQLPSLSLCNLLILLSDFGSFACNLALELNGQGRPKEKREGAQRERRERSMNSKKSSQVFESRQRKTTTEVK